MKVYLNAQFSDGARRTHLLSVGMVSELGEFYRVIKDDGAVEHAMRSDWVKEHVLTCLPLEVDGKDWFWLSDGKEAQVRVSRVQAADDMLGFVDAHPDPEFWAWQGAYAYVAIRHLFGKLTDRPANFPAWCGELAAEWGRFGKPELPERGSNGHHALEQAKWARDVDILFEEFRNP